MKTIKQLSRPLELVLYASSPLATLISAPILARSLGPGGRGEYGVITAVCMFALTVSAWGQAEAYLAEAKSGHLGYHLQSVISVVFGTVAVAVSCGVLLTLGIPFWTALAATVWIPFLNQTNLWRSVAVARQSLIAPALGGFTYSSLRVAGLVISSLLSTLTLTVAVLVNQLAAVLSSTFTVGRTARRFRTVEKSERGYRVLLKAGLGVILFDVFNALSLRSDVIVLQVFSSPEVVGIYAAPAALTTAVLGLTAGFKARMQAVAVSEGVGHRLAKEARTILVLAAAGACLIFFAAPIVVNLILGPQYEASVNIMRLLAPATAALVMFDLAQGLLVVLGKRRQLVAIGAASAFVNVAILLLLCPVAGAEGAAIASSVGYALSALISWLYLIRAP